MKQRSAEPMCGIAGILSYEASVEELEKIKSVPALLRHRGPDFQHSVIKDRVAFAHARLSIIDTSAASNQPFADETGNYLIVFNGEIFNYKELRAELEQAGETFRSNGDVEVLLKLYKKEKSKCLDRLRGFFAFAIYDVAEKMLFIARDRFGVKPLYFTENHKTFCFSSELRPLMYLPGTKELNTKSLTTYFELNYLAGKDSILKGIQRLEPGHFIRIYPDNASERIPYYTPKTAVTEKNKEKAVPKLRKLLEDAVADRLVADVEVGSFLSGGIDSTIVTALAAKQTQRLHTFSLGFRDNAFYDESKLAESTAKKLGTDHHTFLLSNDDLLNAFDDFLNAIDEPFADSSALNVFILSRETKKHVKVVLSGDGADEVFGGYNKHRAEWLMRHNKHYNTLARTLAPFTALVPQSRNSFISNKARQVKKYNESQKLGLRERYWKLASISSAEDVKKLLLHGVSNKELKEYYTRDINEDLNTFLLADVRMLLPYDMLTKVDMMSMANGLEVRNPFLDHRLVEFAFSLPAEMKLSGKAQKIILKESCKDLIPEEILSRPKHGFEVPIQQWLAGELRSRLENEWLNEDFLHAQGIFSVEAIRQLKKQLFSHSPGDSAAKVWAILIFNHWYKKYIS